MRKSLQTEGNTLVGAGFPPEKLFETEVAGASTKCFAYLDRFYNKLRPGPLKLAIGLPYNDLDLSPVFSQSYKFPPHAEVVSQYIMMNSAKTLPARPAHRTIFTPAEANATLPLVSAIVSDLVDLSRELTERRQRLGLLLAGKAKHPRDPYHEELIQIQSEMEKDTLRLRDYVGELRALGVEPKSGTEGLVDFPALLDGRKVYLCWKIGESRVLFWHDLEAGFMGRQPVRPDCHFQSEEDETTRGLVGGASQSRASQSRASQN